MFQVSFKDFQGSFKEVSRVFQGRLMGISRVFEITSKGISGKIQRYFKDVPRKFL